MTIEKQSITFFYFKEVDLLNFFKCKKEILFGYRSKTLNILTNKRWKNLLQMFFINHLNSFFFTDVFSYYILQKVLLSTQNY